MSVKVSYLDAAKRNINPTFSATQRIKIMKSDNNKHRNKHRNQTGEVISMFVYNPYAHLGLKMDTTPYDDLENGCICMEYDCGIHDVSNCEYDKSK